VEVWGGGGVINCANSCDVPLLRVRGWGWGLGLVGMDWRWGLGIEAVLAELPFKGAIPPVHDSSTFPHSPPPPPPLLFVFSAGICMGADREWHGVVCASSGAPPRVCFQVKSNLLEDWPRGMKRFQGGGHPSVAADLFRGGILIQFRLLVCLCARSPV
jgi:hypothetical protein